MFFRSKSFVFQKNIFSFFDELIPFCRTIRRWPELSVSTFPCSPSTRWPLAASWAPSDTRSASTRTGSPFGIPTSGPWPTILKIRVRLSRSKVCFNKPGVPNHCSVNHLCFKSSTKNPYRGFNTKTICLVFLKIKILQFCCFYVTTCTVTGKGRKPLH